MNSEEIWKSVVGYEGLYEVSNFGRIRALARAYCDKNGRVSNIKERIMKQPLSNTGYHHTALRKNGISVTRNLHRIIAEAFIPNPDNKPCINHINGDKSDNTLINLEWVTHAENIQHAGATGLMKFGINHHGSKLDEEKVRFIRENVTTNGGDLTYEELGRMFNVSRHSLQCVVYRRTWKRVD